MNTMSKVTQAGFVNLPAEDQAQVLREYSQRRVEEANIIFEALDIEAYDLPEPEVELAVLADDEFQHSCYEQELIMRAWG